MKRTISRLIVALTAILWLPYPTLAQTGDKEFQALYKEYLDLYNTQDNDEAFFDASERMKQYYIDKKDEDSYYKIEMNEAMFYIEHGYPYQAIRKATEMLDEMKEHSFDGYNMVYMTLGTVFESRGNYGMAEHYYLMAIESTDEHDDHTIMGAYSRMAYLLKLTKPDEARQWNEKYSLISLKYPPYHQVYLFISSIIAFAKGEQNTFWQCSKEYHEYHNQHAELDNYGMKTMAIMEKAFAGNYQEALTLLDQNNDDLDLLARNDLRIRIYEMQGKLEMALRQSRIRTQCVDSLNSDLLFNNLNELNAEAGLAKMKAETAHERLRLLTTVLVLALIAILLLVILVWRHRVGRRRLKQKNEQLNTALSMAEESDKMKTAFVRSVSHEIRTPLNAINGFNEVVNNPDIHLTAEERTDLINRIKENVGAITNIVDEMLQMADQGSSDFYPRTGSIYCNQFLSQLLYAYRDRVSANIELLYTTKVINRFAISTNQEGVKKILNHLILNAIKFTKEGSIELNCRQSDDLSKVIITLTDTGCGISKEEQEKIFDQFYKSDTFQQGIGLGLTVSKKIAQKLGGDLTIDDSYTNGARFVLTLPFE